MVDWLAGKRVKGTSSERTTLQDSILGGTGVGGWVELGRFSGSATTLNVSSLPNKRYYMILSYAPSLSQEATSRIQFNGSNSGYSNRLSYNGGTDNATSYLNFDALEAKNGSETHIGWFDVGYIANYATKEKLVQMWNVSKNTSSPTRQERVGKWTNTTDSINRITYYFPAGGGITYGAGSELVVLGYDPADTHTNNFWEELASVELSSASDTLSSGTITAKKYLWVQTFVKATGGTVEPDSRFNNDNSGTNNVSGTYADRYSINGGSDGTGTNLNKGVRGSGVPVSAFFNDFIINNASNEKLVIRHVNYVSTAGAGYAPNRRETVGKWSNTSNQITDITWHDESGSGAQMDSGSFIKVWGAD